MKRAAITIREPKAKKAKVEKGSKPKFGSEHFTLLQDTIKRANYQDVLPKIHPEYYRVMPTLFQLCTNCESLVVNYEGGPQCPCVKKPMRPRQENHYSKTEVALTTYTPEIVYMLNRMLLQRPCDELLLPKPATFDIYYFRDQEVFCAQVAIRILMEERLGHMLPEHKPLLFSYFITYRMYTQEVKRLQ